MHVRQKGWLLGGARGARKGHFLDRGGREERRAGSIQSVAESGSALLCCTIGTKSSSTRSDAGANRFNFLAPIGDSRAKERRPRTERRGRAGARARQTRCRARRRPVQLGGCGSLVLLLASPLYHESLHRSSSLLVPSLCLAHPVSHHKAAFNRGRDSIQPRNGPTPRRLIQLTRQTLPYQTLRSLMIWSGSFPRTEVKVGMLSRDSSVDEHQTCPSF